VIESLGEIKSIDMPKDLLTGLTKGYAIFEMKDEEENVAILS